MDLDEVAPSVRGTAVDVNEPVLQGELPGGEGGLVPPGKVRIGSEGSDRPVNVGVSEMAKCPGSGYGGVAGRVRASRQLASVTP